MNNRYGTDGNLYALEKHLKSLEDGDSPQEEMDEDDYMQSRQGRVKRGSRWHGDDE